MTLLAHRLIAAVERANMENAMPDRSIADLINQIADLIEPHTMQQDLDKARTAAHQQTMESEQDRVRARARAVLRRVWDYERERAEASGSAFRAAHARAKIADLDAEAAD